MDMAPLILICTPILFPVLVLKMGMDPIHFGIMLLLNLSIGLCTPPVGTALFVGSAVGKISIERAAKGCVPFYIAMLIALALVTYIPAITMTIPNWLMPGK
jgi:TRAP-type C4-dicarboxylate transport system permease large subunit